MRNLDKRILQVSLEYLYWFSRFEYTLKVNRYFTVPNNNKKIFPAQPNWENFRLKYEDIYTLSENGKNLINLSPKRQIAKKVDSRWELGWEDIKFNKNDSDLYKIIRLLKTVRNNLFHGGKHHSKSIGDKERDLELIRLSTLIIKEIADIDNFGTEIFEPYQNFNIKEELFLPLQKDA